MTLCAWRSWRQRRRRRRVERPKTYGSSGSNFFFRPLSSLTRFSYWWSPLVSSCLFPPWSYYWRAGIEDFSSYSSKEEKKRFSLTHSRLPSCHFPFTFSELSSLILFHSYHHSECFSILRDQFFCPHVRMPFLSPILSYSHQCQFC